MHSLQVKLNCVLDKIARMVKKVNKSFSSRFIVRERLWMIQELEFKMLYLFLSFPV